MDTEQILIQRERRFEVADLAGFDAIVSREEADDCQFFAELLDFSRTGVKFSLPFFAKFDEILSIQFKLKNSDLQYTGNGRVRHIRNIEQNRWQVGCSLDPPLPDDVVGFLAKTTNQERRRFERIEVAEQQGNLLRQGKADGCEAKLINVSKGGLCLWVPKEHRTGERVDFVIANKAGQDETILARIRWQSESSGGFRLGCSFADSTSYEKLVDCIVEKQDAVTGDSINWYVAAAAILVMFIPPATYFLMGFGNQTAPAQAVAMAAEHKADEPATETAAMVGNDTVGIWSDKPETTASELFVDAFEVNTESTLSDQVSKIPTASNPANDGGLDSKPIAGPDVVRQSPIDDFLSGVGSTLIETESPTAESESASEQKFATNSVLQKPSEKTGIETAPAMSASGPGLRRNTVAVGDSNVMQKPPIKNPDRQPEVAVMEPSPPEDLLSGGTVKIQTVRSGEASTRRVTATHSLDVPSEKISE